MTTVFVEQPALFKGEQGTAELGTNTVLKQPNELSF
jgi:hypothetical protein